MDQDIEFGGSTIKEVQEVFFLEQPPQQPPQTKQPKAMSTPSAKAAAHKALSAWLSPPTPTPTLSMYTVGMAQHGHSFPAAAIPLLVK